MIGAVEVNFDGLIGPTHNYAGLSFGNIASAANADMVSNPREAALQGLSKMRALMDLGLTQGVIPPQDRPHVPTLRALGFTGADAEVIATAAKHEPGLLRNVSAASCMWTANAATVSPSADTADGRVHFTPANLVSMFHRSIEAEQTATTLKAMFADEAYFAHHSVLPATAHFGDEGAANHSRLVGDYGDVGVHFFVYGKDGFDNASGPKRFPARQTREASVAIARAHGLSTDRVVLAQQNPAAIDAGAFHNDVVAVANRNVLFFHEDAFLDTDAVLRDLASAKADVTPVMVSRADVPLEDAIKSYLFNSQLVRPAGGNGHVLILPKEAEETETTRNTVASLVAGDGPITDAKFLDVRQSMRNGGGPACLRLRVVLTSEEQAAVTGKVILNDATVSLLEDWVKTHYRDRLSPEDLMDPALLDEGRTALDALTQILGLGSIYEFQR